MYDHLNIVSNQHPFIPTEAFLFIPLFNQESKNGDDFKIGNGKTTRRLLFQGWAEGTYSEFERKSLAQFQIYLDRKEIEIDQRWNKFWRLRFLQSVGFDYKKCVKEMADYILYINKYKEVKMTSQILNILKNGLFYIGGRDCHYRPIMVFDVKKIIQAKLKEDEMLEVQIFFFEFVLRNMLIPGQVQNWVAVIDCGHEGLFSLFGSMSDFISFLSNTYRCRMFVAYVVNCPFSISIGWGLAKKFLQEQTIRKINFFDNQIITPLLQSCDASQVEKKYGGTLEDITQFWPPKERSTKYSNPRCPVKLSTKQRYTADYKQKRLHDTRIHEDLILEPSLNETSNRGWDGTQDNFKKDFVENRLKNLEGQFRMGLEMVYGEDIQSLTFSRQVATHLEPLLTFKNVFTKQ